jgi:quinolinate synthase
MNNQQIIEKIEKLKKQKNAVILAHNYQIAEVQDIADYTGDSLGLSQIVSKTDADIIVFAGVYFMAETAKILSPHKKVLITDKTAGCPMADMITAEDVKKLRQENPDAIIVAYVNTSAEVKAEVDVCCTSGNAVKLIESLDKDKDIIFVPDKYLGGFVNKVTNRNMILWHGYCPTHIAILPEDVKNAKKIHPNAEVLVHPECREDVIELVDYAFSTAQMSKHVEKSDCNEFIIGTENGMLHRLKKDNPKKEFYSITERSICPNMKKTTLEKVLWSLEKEEFEITLSEDIIKKAKKSVNKMISILG